jgi:formate hydrogenlyase subunit 3/multisubunit Na+/H+ antiporter MnhD subunit
MMGYAVMVEIGFSLLTAGTPGGLPLHFSLLLPRALSLGVWALALSAVQARTGSLDFRLVQGAARRMPVAVAGIMAAHFTLAGLPLFAGFPVRLALWEALAGQYPWAALWTLLGSVGLMAGGLSSLAVLLRSSDNQTWQITETQMEVSLLLVGILALIIIGLFPQWFFPAFTNLPGSFTRLVP